MFKPDCSFEEAWDASVNGPRNYYDIPWIDDLYEIQDYLQREGKQEMADSVIKARLSNKCFYQFVCDMRDAGLVDDFMSYLEENNEKSFYLFEKLFSDYKPKVELSVVDDSRVGTVS